MLVPRFPGYKCCGKWVYDPQLSLCCRTKVVNRYAWMNCDHYIRLHPKIYFESLFNDTAQ
ncbi:hypothetical protein NP493_33g01008 [Ridgeia piscesae]|uniref:Uncharacterized protein n=1 Tax=Ridgeia piscesae TaxID=27915 RepID=A0AAD9PCV1_RIDPI|nr:hypothetical protein NP493_33g01008 [Ridgeia piscesae]